MDRPKRGRPKKVVHVEHDGTAVDVSAEVEVEVEVDVDAIADKPAALRDAKAAGDAYMIAALIEAMGG